MESVCVSRRALLEAGRKCRLTDGQTHTHRGNRPCGASQATGMPTAASTVTLRHTGYSLNVQHVCRTIHTPTHTHTSSSLASTLMRCVGVQQSPLTIPTSPLPLPAVSPSPWYSAGGAEGGGPTSLISYPKNKAAPPTRRLPLPLERLKKKKLQKCVTL